MNRMYSKQVPSCARERREEREERGGSISGGPHVFKLLKNVIIHKQKIKLSSDYTIKFVLINTSKQDVT
jgi:hypothetical protein